MQLNTYLGQNQDSVSVFLELFEILGAEPVIKEEMLSRIENMDSFLNSANQESGKKFRSQGYYSEMELTIMATILSDGKYPDVILQNNPVFLGALIDKLLSLAVLQRAPPYVHIVPNRFAIQKNLLDHYRTTGFIESAIYGSNHMLKQLSGSIPAINVKTPSGDIHCGTGALLKYRINEVNRSFVLTNKHVLEGNELIEVISGQEAYTVVDEPNVCEFADLALIEVSVPSETRPVVMLGRSDLPPKFRTIQKESLFS